jgi:hypothetical protein
MHRIEDGFKSKKIIVKNHEANYLEEEILKESFELNLKNTYEMLSNKKQQNKSRMHNQ